MSGESAEQRVVRLAAIDGLTVIRAETQPQARNWGGKLAVLDQGGGMLYAADEPDALRAWLHINAGGK